MTIYAHALNILPRARQPRQAKQIDINQTRKRQVQSGYIAGTGDGIVTVRGHAAKREVLLMDANSRDYKFVGRVWSLDNGHYMFTDLDPNKEYLVMARDYNKEYEPFAYDYVQPATDITPDQQQALRESWQI